MSISKLSRRILEEFMESCFVLLEGGPLEELLFRAGSSSSKKLTGERILDRQRSGCMSSSVCSRGWYVRCTQVNHVHVATADFFRIPLSIRTARNGKTAYFNSDVLQLSTRYT